MEEGGALQSWCGEPKFGKADSRDGTGATARQGGALAELGVMRDVQQLFVASSLTAHF